MPTIVRSARADEDLIAIWSYIASHDLAAADRTLDAIERAWSRLIVFPWSGVARDDLAPGLRQVVSGNYLIFYRASDAAIDIVRVLHGRRRTDADVL